MSEERYIVPTPGTPTNQRISPDLLIAVDDTTNTLAQAAFHTTKDTRGYLMLLEGLVRRRGSSSATTPPCLHCRQEITAKGRRPVA